MAYAPMRNVVALDVDAGALLAKGDLTELAARDLARGDPSSSSKERTRLRSMKGREWVRRGAVGTRREVSCRGRRLGWENASRAFQTRGAHFGHAAVVGVSVCSRGHIKSQDRRARRHRASEPLRKSRTRVIIHRDAA